MEKVNTKKGPGTEHLVHLSPLDNELDGTLQTESSSSSSSRSGSLLRKINPISLYPNLLDVIKKEKDKERRLSKQESAVGTNDVMPDNKKVYQKSRSDIIGQPNQKGDNEDVFVNSYSPCGPVNIVINNVFKIGASEKPQNFQEQLIQTYNEANQATLSFINKLRPQKSDSDIKTTTINKPQEPPFRHLIFNRHLSVSKEDFLSHIRKIQKGLVYAQRHIKPPDESKIAAKALVLEPLTEGKKTLVLDLDDTLVHVVDGQDTGDITLKVKIGESGEMTIGVRLRPYLKYFLEKTCKKYEIIVFTAAQASYATAVVDKIDPEAKFIKHVISRDHCLATKNGFFIKDLRIFTNRDLKDVLIVDNIAHSFSLQIDNGIPILDYKDNPNDKELKYLAKYLLKCAEAENPREFNKNSLRLKELMDLDLSSISRYF